MNGKSKMIKLHTVTLHIMILRKTYYLSLLGLFLFSITNSCGQKNNTASKNEINNFIKITQKESIEIFEGWNVWERSDGIVFDFMDNKYRLLVVCKNEEKVLFKEIFPKQDSVFYPLTEIENRSNYYPFRGTNFADKVFLFKKLKADRVNSIIEDSLIMFVNKNFSIIYSQKGTDIRELNRYKGYSKYDNSWYYYLKE